MTKILAETYGWLGKSQEPVFTSDHRDQYAVNLHWVYAKHKGPIWWGKEDWPPRKVKITVEEVEQ